jgi:hypothetical protein
MTLNRNVFAAVVVAAAAALLIVPANSAAGGVLPGLPTADPSAPADTVVSGQVPVANARTIPHWHSQFTDPTNGVTYGYDMAGSDPALNQDTTIPVDIVPLDFVFAGSGDYALRGSDIVANVVSSPMFQPSDFSYTPLVTGPMDSSQHVNVLPGGPLSAGNTGVQYEDAVMRAQFNKVGTSYHLRLGAPTVWPAETIQITQGQGEVFRNSRGVVWGYEDRGKFLSFTGQMHVDPTHLVIFLTNNVFIGAPGKWCCNQGLHSSGSSDGRGGGSTDSNGNAQVGTWIFGAYVQPGTYNPSIIPFAPDVAVLSHEIAEWADDPYGTNLVNPWMSPLPPQSGCAPILETGDPVDRVGYALPGNTFDSGSYADGYWHMQDVMFLPWYSRQAPNTTSQPTQQPSASVGRYSFIGDLNPYADFHQPATNC